MDGGIDDLDLVEIEIAGDQIGPGEPCDDVLGVERLQRGDAFEPLEVHILKIDREREKVLNRDRAAELDIGAGPIPELGNQALLDGLGVDERRHEGGENHGWKN